MAWRVSKAESAMVEIGVGERDRWENGEFESNLKSAFRRRRRLACSHLCRSSSCNFWHRKWENSTGRTKLLRCYLHLPVSRGSPLPPSASTTHAPSLSQQLHPTKPKPKPKPPPQQIHPMPSRLPSPRLRPLSTHHTSSQSIPSSRAPLASKSLPAPPHITLSLHRCHMNARTLWRGRTGGRKRGSVRRCAGAYCCTLG